MGEARSGKKRGAPAPVVGRLLEPLYAAAVRRRNAGFDNGREAARFVGASGKKIPVISIGNLSVGGTGKTPLVMHTVRVLMEHGMRPCVAMRGYSKSKDGAADETDAYRRAFPGMVVVAQADRTAGLREVLGDGRAGDGRGRDATREEPAGDQRATRIGPAGEQRGTRGPDVIVLDDGFQHRQIARDVDVVLIDATPGRSVFADRLLPAGWLREPVENLRRASMVVLTHAEMATREDVEGLKREIGKYMRGPVAVTRHVWVGLRHDVRKEEPGSENRGTQGAAGSENRGTREGMSLEVLRGRRVVGCCAIGHPDGFRASLERAVGGACEVMALPDHDPFGAGTVEKVCAMARRAGAEYLVVTDKDWSKLRNVAAETWPCPVVRPELALEFDEGEGVFAELVVRAGGGT